MTRRRRLRRRLLWAGVLLGLLFLLAALSMLRAGFWARSRLTAHARPTRKEHTMQRRTSLAIIAALGALVVAAPASADDWGADRNDRSAATSVLDARERALVAKQDAEPAPGWFGRFAAAHSMRDPVGDDRVRGNPTDTTTTPVTASSGRDVEWPQIGIGFALAIALGIGVLLLLRPTDNRPLTR